MKALVLAFALLATPASATTLFDLEIDAMLAEQRAESERSTQQLMLGDMKREQERLAEQVRGEISRLRLEMETKRLKEKAR